MTKRGTSFAELLRKARTDARMSQSDLERRSGIPKTTLSRYENGHVEPSLGTLRRLAEALDTDESELLPGEPTAEHHLAQALQRHGVKIESAADADRIAVLVAGIVENEEGSLERESLRRRA